MDLTFPSKAAYHEMCEKIRYFEIDGKECRALCHEREIGQKLDGDDDKKSVFVRNLPASMKQAELHQIYQEYGFIVSLKIAMDANHASKGYGYITFRDEKSAKAAVDAGAQIGKDKIVAQPYNRHEKQKNFKNFMEKGQTVQQKF